MLSVQTLKDFSKFFECAAFFCAVKMQKAESFCALVLLLRTSVMQPPTLLGLLSFEFPLTPFLLFG